MSSRPCRICTHDYDLCCFAHAIVSVSIMVADVVTSIMCSYLSLRDIIERSFERKQDIFNQYHLISARLFRKHPVTLCSLI
jgi:hypothetical protein